MADYKIQIGTQLDTKGIDAGINKYHQKKTIEFKSKLDTNGIDKKIAAYKAKKPIEIETKLNTKGLAKKIGDLKPKTPIKLTAKLDTKSVNAAIKNVQAKPINIDVKLNTKNINQQLNGVKITNPIKVNAKLDSKSINQQIRGYNSPTIKINAKINKKDIDTVIKGYKPKPIKLDAEIKKTALNKQISDFTPKKTIKLKASLQKGAIADEIRKYKPNTPIKVDLQLDYSDIDKKVGEYIAKGPIELPVKLKAASKGFSDGVTKNPVKVNAELNPEDVKKISSQLSSIQPETPIIVKAKLDDTAIDTAISEYQSKTPTIKVNVKVNDDDVDKETRQQSVQKPIQVNVKLDRQDINEQLRTFTTKTKIKVGIKLESKGIAEQIRKIDTKTKIKVGVQLDPNDIAQQIGGINTGTPIMLGVQLNPNDVQNVQNQINNLIQQLQNGRNVNINLDTNINNGGNGGNGHNGDGGRRQANEATQAYRELLGVLNELNSKRLQLNNLDASSPQSAEKIQRLRLQIEQLDNEYNNLLRSFNAQGIQFTAEQWNQLETIIARVGRRIDVVQAGMSDKSAIQNQTQAYRELLSVSKEISSLEINIEKLRLQGGNSNQIEVLENNLRTLQSTYQQLVTTMNTPLTSNQWSAIYTQVAKMSEEIAELRARYADAKAELSQNIKADIGSGELQRKINDVRESFSLLRVENQGVKDDIERLQTLLNSMGSSNDIESVTNDYKEFLQLLETVKNSVAELKREQSNSSEMLDLKKASAMEKLNNLFEDGSQAARQFGERARQLAEELNKCGAANVGNVTKKVQILGDEVKRSGLQTKTLGTRLKEQFSKYYSYFSVASVFMYATQAARSMFEQVKLIDSAMTELKKVTNETDASYNNFLGNAASRAKELGTTIDGLVASTADFARLGYGFQESQKLAEVANIYAVVGDEIEGVEDATQSLVSTMAAFKNDMNGMSNDDFAMSIVDKMNEVSNNFAISSGGIGQALQRSASSMAAANNTLDETIAMITAANEVAQNPEKVGKRLCRLKKWLYRLKS